MGWGGDAGGKRNLSATSPWPRMDARAETLPRISLIRSQNAGGAVGRGNVDGSRTKVAAARAAAS